MGSAPIHILLVEDDEDHAELIRLGFESRGGGMVLAIARSLEEARARLAESAPDAVIIDSLLPDGRGVELLPAGRDLPYPVVLLTSHGDEAMKAEAIAAGVSEYVVKSDTTLLDLPDIAKSALEKWESGGPSV